MTAKPKIVILIKGLGIGGAERLISEAVQFWDRDRFEYRVAYLLPWKDQLVPSIQTAGVQVVQLGNGKLGPTTFRAVRTYFREIEPDLVHAHLPSTGILARMTSPAPVVYTEHNVVSSYRQPTRAINRATYGRNTRLIAVSGAVAESVTSYPKPAPIVIPNGVSVSVSAEEKNRARVELGIDENTLLVSHVGNIRPHKGHQNLIDAVARLKDSKNPFLVVSIGGEKNPGDLERITNSARSAGVDGALRFLGRREDALAFVGASDMMVNPSDHEGLPLAILEAMSLGKPVVATAVGGVPSVIESGVTGLLVPVADATELAQSLENLISDPALRSRLGSAAQQVALERHGLGSMIQTVERVYEDILAS